MTKVSSALGRWGETLAAQHLVANGMVLLDRNWRSATGEIDIIARDGDTLVFCEVKTRRGNAFGDPAEAVVGPKEQRLRALAGQWLARSGLRAREVRFDVVKIVINGRSGPDIDHVRGAF
ncbi:YraN family protein [Allorhizocola rhizosphaerae]|uniref:YraN family protein n=1 Tax=Allorhizocola rhizosphaerae TaxID=1872709 RepID=UPI000E3D3BF3|nr:YraN family protein [Allorhizocola rhizosphaerae]